MINQNLYNQFKQVAFEDELQKIAARPLKIVGASFKNLIRVPKYLIESGSKYRKARRVSLQGGRPKKEIRAGDAYLRAAGHSLKKSKSAFGIIGVGAAGLKYSQ